MSKQWYLCGGGVREDSKCGLCDPVVVIDPEDRKAVERLGDLFADERDKNGGQSRLVVGGWADAMQAALREFANPKPPKPEEPAGLGAVVEDLDGRRWVRDLQHNLSPNQWLWSTDEGVASRKGYADIDVVKVLSEGVPS